MHNNDPKDREDEYFHHGRLLNTSDTDASDASVEIYSSALFYRIKGIPCADTTAEHIGETTILFTTTNKTNRK